MYDNDPEYAYELFEVLNDRGKSLAICDYLRSSTLEMIDGHKDEDDILGIWNNMGLNSNGDTYIKDYLISHQGSVKRTNLHKQFRDKFFKSDLDISESDKQTQIIERIKNLNEIYVSYNHITNGEYPYQSGSEWSKSRLKLLIKQLKHTQCIPLLMAIYENNKNDDSIFINTVEMLEKIIFRVMTICGGRANQFTKIYSDAIKKIRSGEEWQDVFKTELINIYSTKYNDTIFSEALKNLTYSNNTIYKIRYLLTNLESNLRWASSKASNGARREPDKTMIINLESIQVEHIYPQTARQENLDVSLELIKHNIGNLSFWSSDDNQAEQNAPFSQKKRIL